MGSEQRLHEIQRGEILRYLAAQGFRAATPKTLLYHLRDMRYASTWRGLTFQLEYLEQKGWLTLERSEPAIGEEQKILAAKITAAGVDLIDRRKAGEEVKF